MERLAFDRLLTNALPRIENAAQKYTALFRCFNEWQDISQSALLKMLRFADLYDPAKGDLLPWACVIIINTIKTHIAQTNTLPDMVDFDALISNPAPGQYYCNPIDELQLAFITSNINQETQLFADGYNYAEIAKLRGIRSKATVKDRIDKCADRLSRILGINKTPGRRVRNVAVIR